MARAGAGERRGAPGAAPVRTVPVEPAVAPAATTDPDVALMLQLQAGDHGAFAELFARLGPRLLQYARRMIGSDARAEELTQDVFVQLFRFRHRYRPESRLTTWVYTIATNLCLNELRRPERRLRVDMHPAGDGDEAAAELEVPDPAMPTAEAGAAGRELSRRLERAVRGLPPKQRAALLLSRIDGLAYRDVARSLGCTEGAVKALLFRATQALRHRLQDCLEEDR